MVLGNLLAGAAGGATVSIIIRAVDSFSKTFSRANAQLLKLGAGITGIGIAGAFAVGGLVKIAGEFEQTQIAFATMLGSAEEGKKVLKELADFAARTPFTIPDVEKNAKLLLAMGIETKNLIPTMKALGDVSAGLNVPLSRIALNFGQVKTQGKLTGRELRDFNVAGVPLIQEIAKNMNLTEEEVKKLVSAGKIGFPEVEKAFKTMTGEGGKFFDLMDKQSKTFLGQVSNIQDSFIKLARIMGEIFLPVAKFVAEHLANIMSWLEKHPTVAKFAGIMLGLATATALIIGPLLIFLGILPLLIAGMGTLTAVSLPVTLTILAIAAGIALLIAGIVALFLWWDKLGAKTKIILGILFPFVVLPVMIVKEWDKLKAAITIIWSFIAGFIEKKVNEIIGFINLLISAFNKLVPARFEMGKIGKVNFTSDDNLNVSKEKLNPMSENRNNQTIINIENVNGLDSEDVSRSLREELQTKISI